MHVLGNVADLNEPHVNMMEPSDLHVKPRASDLSGREPPDLHGLSSTTWPARSW